MPLSTRKKVYNEARRVAGSFQLESEYIFDVSILACCVHPTWTPQNASSSSSTSMTAALLTSALGADSGYLLLYPHSHIAETGGPRSHSLTAWVPQSALILDGPHDA